MSLIEKINKNIKNLATIGAFLGILGYNSLASAWGYTNMVPSQQGRYLNTLAVAMRGVSGDQGTKCVINCDKEWVTYATSADLPLTDTLSELIFDIGDTGEKFYYIYINTDNDDFNEHAIFNEDNPCTETINLQKGGWTFKWHPRIDISIAQYKMDLKTILEDSTVKLSWTKPQGVGERYACIANPCTVDDNLDIYHYNIYRNTEPITQENKLENLIATIDGEKTMFRDLPTESGTFYYLIEGIDKQDRVPAISDNIEVNYEYVPVSTTNRLGIFALATLFAGFGVGKLRKCGLTKNLKKR